MARLPKGLSRKDAYKAIKPFVNFTWGHYETVTQGKNKGKKRYVPPTESEKKKVVRYYHLLVGGKGRTVDAHGNAESDPGLFSTPRHHYTGRLTKRQKQIAEHRARIPRGYPRLRGVLLPVASERGKIRVRFETTSAGVEVMIIEEAGVSTRGVPFDAYEEYEGEFAADGEPVVQRLLDDNPGESFRIVCGESVTKSTIDRAGLVEKVMLFQSKYTEEAGHKSNWQDWMFGVESAEYEDEATIDDYNRMMAEGRTTAKAKTANARRGRSNGKPLLSPQGRRKKKQRGTHSTAHRRQNRPGRKAGGGRNHGHAPPKTGNHRTGHHAHKRPKTRR